MQWKICTDMLWFILSAKLLICYWMTSSPIVKYPMKNLDFLYISFGTSPWRRLGAKSHKKFINYKKKLYHTLTKKVFQFSHPVVGIVSLLNYRVLLSHLPGLVFVTNFSHLTYTENNSCNKKFKICSNPADINRFRSHTGKCEPS